MTMVAAISSVLPETKAGNSTPPLLQPEEINKDHNRNRNRNHNHQNQSNNNQRRPRAREIASRYMSMSPSSSHSISSSTSSTSSSSRNSFSGTSTGGGDGGGVGRSKSTPRRRKPTHDAEMQAVSKLLATTSRRSVSVSFQGGSFSVPISRTKGERNVSPESRRGKVDGGARSATVDRRKSTPLRGKNTTPERRRSAPLRGEVDGGQGRGGGRNSKGGDQMIWPAISKQFSTISRSLECSNNECKDYDPPRLVARALNDSLFDENDSVDGLSMPSDSESISSGSSGAQETNGGSLGRGGVVVDSSKFWQETNMRLRRLRDPRLGLSSSPSLKFVAPMKGLNPSHVRSSVGGLMCCSPWEAPSVLSFAVDVRRANVGENRISDAHQLRLLYNRHLQWRFVAARADAALSVQRRNAEKNIWNAWITITGRRDSVRNKRIQLQLLRQKLKLMSVLREQIAYLMEWSRLDESHSCSLQGTIESLKASTLRLPVVGVTADVEKLKDALSSAVDVMQSIASSMCFLTTKVEEMNSMTTELSRVAGKERFSIEKCIQVLSILSTMQVKDCSLRTHMLQLNRLSVA